MLENVENLLYPTNKKERPLITYDIAEGSVRNIFTTSKQAVVQFTAVALFVASSGSLEGLELPTAKAIESLQKQAFDKDFEFEFTTSEQSTAVLNISPRTHYERATNLWVDAEFYFYGVLKDAGGKDKANIHLDTKEFGYIPIRVTQQFLSSQEGNILYKSYGVRVRGKQNLDTNEIDKSDLELVGLVDYSQHYDENYLNNLIRKASPKFNNLDADAWLAELRGGLI